MTTTEPTVEEALKELREMCPRARINLVSMRSGNVEPHGGVGISESAYILIEPADGTDDYSVTSKSLSEAMAQVRAHFQEQEKK